jgi:hypothetical protein
MPIECSSALCTVNVAINYDGKLAFVGGQCIELLGTHYVHRFECCPVLAYRVAGNQVSRPER